MENENLVMDFYQLTMAYSYFKQGRQNKKAYFDMFFRKIPDDGGYVIFNGLDKVIDYIKNFKFSKDDIDYLRGKGDFDEGFLNYLNNFKFKGDIYAVPDGTVVFPNEPLITVRGNMIEAQLIETKLLLLVNYSSLVTTKANRIANAAEGRGVLEFGTRRAQGVSASIEGAKYAYIGGCIGTSNVQTEKKYGIPSTGTMAHSYIEFYDTEYEAFMAYAKTFPDKSIFLVDTYDTLKSGVPNAIRVAKEYLIPNGYRLKGIRLDSGDLTYLSKRAREMLDDAGLTDCKIIASNSLDEYLIRDLINQGAKIDIFGVGENLITAKSCPVFGGVYKLVAMEKNNEIISRIKLSDNIEKITNPGYKKLYRFYHKETGYAFGDIIALHDELILKNEFNMPYFIKQLQVPIFKEGTLVYNIPTIDETKAYCKSQVETLEPEIRMLDNPKKYNVSLTLKLLNLKKKLIMEHSNFEKKEVKKLMKENNNG